MAAKDSKHTSIDPYDRTTMIAKFKGCINDFKALETTDNSISFQIDDFNNRKIRLVIKAIICYIKWVATVRIDHPNLNQEDHFITAKKNRALTKVLYYNSHNCKENFDSECKYLSDQRGYKSCKLFVNSITTAVNFILNDDSQYYNFITSSSLSDSALELSLLENYNFLSDTSIKSEIINKPKFKCIEYTSIEENNVIDDNDDDDGADQDLYLLEGFMYPFEERKVVYKVTKYFENVHCNTFRSGTSSLGTFEGVDGMWTTSVVIQIASVLNDVFRNHTGDIFGIDFGHGSALTMFILLESLNSSKFNMTGLEVCSLYIIYYFSLSN